MRQPSFPLFKPAKPEDAEDLVFGVHDVLTKEVRRAALEGSDPQAVEHVRFTIDLSPGAEMMLQALATALGSSRRAMAAKLCTGAILEAVNMLFQADADRDPEMLAVRLEYQEALRHLEQEAGT